MYKMKPFHKRPHYHRQVRKHARRLLKGKVRVKSIPVIPMAELLKWL